MIFLFLLLTIVFLYLFTALRIYAAAGDNASRFFKNTPWEDLVLLLALSTGMGLLSTTQIFGVRRAVKKIESKTAGLSLASFLSGLASVVFASATCAACLGSAHLADQADCAHAVCGRVRRDGAAARFHQENPGNAGVGNRPGRETIQGVETWRKVTHTRAVASTTS